MPTWDVSARIFGLPVTHWKKRTGFELSGTLAVCVARWLDLPDHHRQNCSLSWREGRRRGTMEPPDIAAYVLAAGLPPHVAARRSGQPSREALRAMVVPVGPQPHMAPAKGDWASIHCKGQGKRGR